MAVVPLTLTISLCLAFTFVIFFLREHARGHLSSAERDSLLPLAEEDRRVVGLAAGHPGRPDRGTDHPAAGR
jgi:hypothetical protein